MAATLVAVAAALGCGLELVARGREEAANARSTAWDQPLRSCRRRQGPVAP
jgi:hypothetical protein